MFHCKDSKCNGVLSDWLPHTKEEAMVHVYNGIWYIQNILNIFTSSLLIGPDSSNSSSESRRGTWIVLPMIITQIISK